MSVKRGEIQLILGPMFSGKTSELIRRIKRYETANHKCMVIKYAKDVRYDDGDEQAANSISTHDRNKLNATMKATELSEQVEQFAAAYSVIGIDEGQFFKDVVEFCEKMANLGKIVIVAALDGTYQRKAFGDILHLVPLAENVIKLSAVCMNCYNDAAFTKRTTSELQVELIGGKESYLAVCRECFYHNNHEVSNEKCGVVQVENKGNQKVAYSNNNKENLIRSPNKVFSVRN